MKNFEMILKAALNAANEGCIVITKNNYVSVTGFSFQASEFIRFCNENGCPLKEVSFALAILQYVDDACVIQVHLV